MGKELNIKHKVIRLLALLTVFIFTITGCVSDKPNMMQEIELSISSGGHGAEDVDFTIHSDGTIKAVVNTFREGEKKLSKAQMRKVDELVTKVKEGNQTDIEPPHGADLVEINTKIDSQSYKSFFFLFVTDDEHELSKCVNKDLVKLASELVKLSPIELEGHKEFRRYQIRVMISEKLTNLLRKLRTMADNGDA